MKAKRKLDLVINWLGTHHAPWDMLKYVMGSGVYINEETNMVRIDSLYPHEVELLQRAVRELKIK